MNTLDSGGITNTLSNNFTSGPGEYRLNEDRNQISYPWAPTMILQKNGGSLMDNNFFDVDSELKNITRKLSSRHRVDSGIARPLDLADLVVILVLSKKWSKWLFGTTGGPPEH